MIAIFNKYKSNASSIREGDVEQEKKHFCMRLYNNLMKNQQHVDIAAAARWMEEWFLFTTFYVSSSK